MLKKFSIVIGVVLIVAAVGWKLAIAPQSDQRFPDGWEWELITLGKTSYPDETGQYVPGTTLADDPINLTTRTVTAKASETAGQVVLDDHFVVRDPVTNAVGWEFTANAVVDAKTGLRSDKDDYYFIPRHVDKTKT